MAEEPILIVDDDDDIREALTDVLELRGYRVITAANGKEALDRLRSAPARIILLDLMMPVMDGYEFRAEQRTRPEIADIPVVVITAGSDVRTDELRSAEVLRKPLDGNALAAAIERHSPADR